MFWSTKYQYIDTHTHILPGIDDGASTLDESVAMLNLATETGVKRLICTPHLIEGDRKQQLDKMQEAYGRLCARASEMGIPITLYLGAELVIDPDLPSYVIEDKRMTIGGLGRHALVEMPMLGIPIFAHSACFELVTRGVTPVWAHPERCLDVINNPEIVRGFIQSGVMLQFNTNSILGNYGSKVKKTVMHLLALGYGNILASDTHRIETIKSLPDAMKKLVNTVGKDKAIDMAFNTPLSLLG